VVEVTLVSAARDEVLGRVRRALGDSPAVPQVPRHARRDGIDATDRPAAAELFCRRVAEYRATVHRGDDVAGAVRAACAAYGARRLACAPGAVLDVDGLDLLPDEPPLPVRRLEALDGVLTGCALAIAETGTIVLDGGPASGRRALTLVPDVHVCVVRVDQIVRDVPGAIAALAPAARAGRPITLVSGPSATSDIELQRVEGVHGPRNLGVVVVG
jgi:L-lactate dehydrogenase complex protein LldG